MFTDGVEKVAAKKKTGKQLAKSVKKPNAVTSAATRTGDLIGRGAGAAYRAGDKAVRGIDKGLSAVFTPVAAVGKGFVRGFKRSAGIKKSDSGRWIYKHPILTAGAVIGASKWLASDPNKENRPAQITYAGQG